MKSIHQKCVQQAAYEQQSIVIIFFSDSRPQLSYHLPNDSQEWFGGGIDWLVDQHGFFYRYLEPIYPIWHRVHFKMRYLYTAIALCCFFLIGLNAAYMIPTGKVILQCIPSYSQTFLVRNLPWKETMPS